MDLINKVISRVLNSLYVIIILAFTLTAQPTAYIASVTIVLDIACLIALIINIVVLKKNPYSYSFKKISMISFLIVYAIILLLSINDNIFTFAFVILSMYILYFDLQLMIVSVSSFLVLNIISIIKSIVLGHMPSGAAIDITRLVVQFLSIAIFGGISYVITKKSNEINKSKIDTIEEQRFQTEQILNNVIEAVEKIKNNVDIGTTIINDLNQTSVTSNDLISKTDKSNDVTVNSVIKQTKLNDNINTLVLNIETNIKDIIDITKDATSELNLSNDKMKELETHSKEITRYNEKVMSAINSFNKKTEQVKNIASGIVDISSQTNSLAICAAIESARAGENGKGFLVVSNEIRNLAEQTKALTADITNVITFLEENVKITSEVVLNTVNSIYKENTIVSDVTRYFDVLTDNIKELDRDMNAILNSTYEMIEFNDKMSKHISQLNISSEDLTNIYENAIKINQKYEKDSQDAKLNMDKLLISTEQLEQYI